MRKNLTKMRLVQLKELHRSIFRQIPPQTLHREDRRKGNPDKKATCATERVAEVDIPTDSVTAICTGRFSDRFFPRRSAERGPEGQIPTKKRLVQPKDLHRSIFRQVFSGMKHGEGPEEAKPDEKATCATERLAEVDIPTDSVTAICTSRYYDRYRRRGQSREPRQAKAIAIRTKPSTKASRATAKDVSQTSTEPSNYHLKAF